MAKKTLLYFLLILAFSSKAQDIHFSQFYASPINLNPALTGMFDGDYRGIANYRSQWSAVPVPYSTFSLSADMRHTKGLVQGDVLGLGVIFNNDVAGDDKYGTNQFYVPINYIKKINTDSNMFISFALQPGLSSIGFKTNAATFDAQYDGDAYNPNLPSGENFQRLNRTYFDINTGVGFKYDIKQRASVTAAISLFHLNTPKVTYFNNDDVELDLKSNTYLNFTYPLAPKLDLVSDFMYTKQGKYHETLLGTQARYILTGKDYQALSGGVFVRFKDAIITRVGYDYKTWKFGISYDVTTSKFIAANKRRGAIEFSVQYIFKKIIPFVAKKRVCPVFM